MEDDVRQQQEHLDATLSALARVLSEVSDEAKSLSRAAKRTVVPDLTDLYAKMRRVATAEEACDIAALDLAGAAGEDL